MEHILHNYLLVCCSYIAFDFQVVHIVFGFVQSAKMKYVLVWKDKEEQNYDSMILMHDYKGCPLIFKILIEYTVWIIGY